MQVEHATRTVYITQLQWRVLEHIVKREGQTMTLIDLSVETGSALATVIRVVDVLHGLGLVRKGEQKEYGYNRVRKSASVIEDELAKCEFVMCGRR